MARAPRPGTRANKVDDRIVIKVDGVEYPLHATEISAADANALRQATGLSVKAVMRAANDDLDIDIVAALVFLSRRQNGAKGIPYAVVADAITYNSEISDETETPESDEADDDPQL